MSEHTHSQGPMWIPEALRLTGKSSSTHCEGCCIGFFVFLFFVLKKNLKLGGRGSGKTWGKGRINLIKIYLSLKVVLNNRNIIIKTL